MNSEDRYETYECGRCPAVFRTKREMDAHMREHAIQPTDRMKKVGTGGGGSGLRAQQLQQQVYDLQTHAQQSSALASSLQRELSKVASERDQLRQDVDTLLGQRIAEAEVLAGQAKLATAQREAIETVARFSDDELEAMGITREDAVARATVAAAPPEVLDMDALRAEAERQKLANIEKRHKLSKVRPATSGMTRMHHEPEQKDNFPLLRSAFGSEPPKPGDRVTLNTTTGKVEKKMRGQRVDKLVVDEAAEYSMKTAEGDLMGTVLGHDGGMGEIMDRTMVRMQMHFEGELDQLRLAAQKVEKMEAMEAASLRQMHGRKR